MRNTVLLVLLFLLPLNVGFIHASHAEESGKELAGNVEAVELSVGTKGVMLPDGDYFKGYLLNGKHIITSPARWDGKDWLTASAIVGVTLGLYALDEDIQEWFQDSQTEAKDKASNFFELFGNGLVVIPSLSALYLYSYTSDNYRLSRASLLSLESFVISGVITNVIKFTGHRHRPSDGSGAYVWDGPSLSTSHLSFPSGHATTAFAVASVFSSEYGYTGYVPVIAYSVASLAALSRIYDNKHWASDVFFGSAIGYFTGKAVHKLHSDENTKVTIFPVIEQDRTFIVASFMF